ncbi:hypothetical protein [Nocardioides convexus]|uniref:hypothetical protein n=1 Tax=Nocardioides convexus TaxID=2712224 RepID=UPI0024187EFC|nr:hypothetical protein [Nocardioides convexus]
MRTFLAGTAAVLALLAGTTGVLTALHPDPVPAPVEVRTPVPPPAPDLPAAPAPVVRVAEPTRIEVPALGVDEPLTGRGLKPDGTLDTPDFGAAAWYAPGPRPGEPGGAVVVAHVHGPDGPDVFSEPGHPAPRRRRPRAPARRGRRLRRRRRRGRAEGAPALRPDLAGHGATPAAADHLRRDAHGGRLPRQHRRLRAPGRHRVAALSSGRPVRG